MPEQRLEARLQTMRLCEKSGDEEPELIIPASGAEASREEKTIQESERSTAAAAEATAVAVLTACSSCNPAAAAAGAAAAAAAAAAAFLLVQRSSPGFNRDRGCEDRIGRDKRRMEDGDRRTARTRERHV